VKLAGIAGTKKYLKATNVEREINSEAKNARDVYRGTKGLPA